MLKHDGSPAQVLNLAGLAIVRVADTILQRFEVHHKKEDAKDSLMQHLIGMLDGLALAYTATLSEEHVEFALMQGDTPAETENHVIHVIHDWLGDGPDLLRANILLQREMSRGAYMVGDRALLEERLRSLKDFSLIPEEGDLNLLLKKVTAAIDAVVGQHVSENIDLILEEGAQ